MFCKGIGGTLELHEDRLVIKHTLVLGLLTGGIKGSKTIPYSAITAVQHKRAGVLSGYMQFTIGGAVESKKGIWDATKDENTLMFTNNEVFDKAKEFLDARIGVRSPSQASRCSRPRTN